MALTPVTVVIRKVVTNQPADTDNERHKLLAGSFSPPLPVLRKHSEDSASVFSDESPMGPPILSPVPSQEGDRRVQTVSPQKVSSLSSLAQTMDEDLIDIALVLPNPASRVQLQNLNGQLPDCPVSVNIPNAIAVPRTAPSGSVLVVPIEVYPADQSATLTDSIRIVVVELVREEKITKVALCADVAPSDQDAGEVSGKEKAVQQNRTEGTGTQQEEQLATAKSQGNASTTRLKGSRKKTVERAYQRRSKRRLKSDVKEFSKQGRRDRKTMERLKDIKLTRLHPVVMLQDILKDKEALKQWKVVEHVEKKASITSPVLTVEATANTMLTTRNEESNKSENAHSEKHQSICETSHTKNPSEKPQDNNLSLCDDLLPLLAAKRLQFRDMASVWNSKQKKRKLESKVKGPDVTRKQMDFDNRENFTSSEELMNGNFNAINGHSTTKSTESIEATQPSPTKNSAENSLEDIEMGNKRVILEKDGTVVTFQLRHGETESNVIARDKVRSIENAKETCQIVPADIDVRNCGYLQPKEPESNNVSHENTHARMTSAETEGRSSDDIHAVLEKRSAYKLTAEDTENNNVVNEGTTKEAHETGDGGSEDLVTSISRVPENNGSPTISGQAAAKSKADHLEMEREDSPIVFNHQQQTLEYASARPNDKLPNIQEMDDFLLMKTYYSNAHSISEQSSNLQRSSDVQASHALCREQETGTSGTKKRGRKRKTNPETPTENQIAELEGKEKQAYVRKNGSAKDNDATKSKPRVKRAYRRKNDPSKWSSVQMPAYNSLLTPDMMTIHPTMHQTQSPSPDCCQVVHQSSQFSPAAATGAPLLTNLLSAPTSMPTTSQSLASHFQHLTPLHPGNMPERDDVRSTQGGCAVTSSGTQDNRLAPTTASSPPYLSPGHHMNAPGLSRFSQPSNMMLPQRPDGAVGPHGHLNSYPPGFAGVPMDPSPRMPVPDRYLHKHPYMPGFQPPLFHPLNRLHQEMVMFQRSRQAFFEQFPHLKPSVTADRNSSSHSSPPTDNMNADCSVPSTSVDSNAGPLSSDSMNSNASPCVSNACKSPSSTPADIINPNKMTNGGPLKPKVNQSPKPLPDSNMTSSTSLPVQDQGVQQIFKQLVGNENVSPSIQQLEEQENVEKNESEHAKVTKLAEHNKASRVQQQLVEGTFSLGAVNHEKMQPSQPVTDVNRVKPNLEHTRQGEEMHSKDTEPTQDQNTGSISIPQSQKPSAIKESTATQGTSLEQLNGVDTLTELQNNHDGNVCRQKSLEPFIELNDWVEQQNDQHALELMTMEDRQTMASKPRGKPMEYAPISHREAGIANVRDDNHVPVLSQITFPNSASFLGDAPEKKQRKGKDSTAAEMTEKPKQRQNRRKGIDLNSPMKLQHQAVPDKSDDSFMGSLLPGENTWNYIENLLPSPAGHTDTAKSPEQVAPESCRVVEIAPVEGNNESVPSPGNDSNTSTAHRSPEVPTYPVIEIVPISEESTPVDYARSEHPVVCREGSGKKRTRNIPTVPQPDSQPRKKRKKSSLPENIRHLDEMPRQQVPAYCTDRSFLTALNPPPNLQPHSAHKDPPPYQPFQNQVAPLAPGQHLLSPLQRLQALSMPSMPGDPYHARPPMSPIHPQMLPYGPYPPNANPILSNRYLGHENRMSGPALGFDQRVSHKERNPQMEQRFLLPWQRQWLEQRNKQHMGQTGYSGPGRTGALPDHMMQMQQHAMTHGCPPLPGMLPHPYRSNMY